MLCTPPEQVPSIANSAAGENAPVSSHKRHPSFHGPSHLTLARRSAPAPHVAQSLRSLNSGGTQPNDASASSLHGPAPSVAALQEPRERHREDGSLQIGPLHVSDKVRAGARRLAVLA